MDAWFVKETESLVKAWASKTREELRADLIEGFQDPRLSIQRILARHFFAHELWPGQFENLMIAEFKYAIRLNHERAVGLLPREEDLDKFGG